MTPWPSCTRRRGRRFERVGGAPAGALHRDLPGRAQDRAEHGHLEEARLGQEPGHPARLPDHVGGHRAGRGWSCGSASRTNGARASAAGPESRDLVAGTTMFRNSDDRSPASTRQTRRVASPAWTPRGRSALDVEVRAERAQLLDEVLVAAADEADVAHGGGARGRERRDEVAEAAAEVGDLDVGARAVAWVR